MNSLPALLSSHPYEFVVWAKPNELFSFHTIIAGTQISEISAQTWCLVAG